MPFLVEAELARLLWLCLEGRASRASSASTRTLAKQVALASPGSKSKPSKLGFCNAFWRSKAASGFAWKEKQAGQARLLQSLRRSKKKTGAVGRPFPRTAVCA